MFHDGLYEIDRRRSTIQKPPIRQRRRKNRRIPIDDPKIDGTRPRESSNHGKCGLLSDPNTSYKITNHSKTGRCLDCDSQGITINKNFNSNTLS